MSGSLPCSTYPASFGQGERIPDGTVCLFALEPANIATDQSGSKLQKGTGAIRGAILGDERPTYAWLPEERRWVLVNIVRATGSPYGARP